MPKNYPANRLDGVMFRINISAEKMEADGYIGYYAAVLRSQARAKDDSTMAAVVTVPDLYLGAKKDVPWTPHEIWVAIGNANLSNIFKNALRDLFEEGIDEDIT